MTIEFVDFPIKHGDFPVRYVAVYQGFTQSPRPRWGIPYKVWFHGMIHQLVPSVGDEGDGILFFLGAIAFTFYTYGNMDTLKS